MLVRALAVVAVILALCVAPSTADAFNPIVWSDVVEVIPGDGTTIPTNARAFVVTDGPGVGVDSTLCDEVDPTSDECVGTNLAVFSFECFGGAPCVHRIALGRLPANGVAHVQVHDRSSDRLHDMVFDVGMGDDVDRPNTPVITGGNLVLGQDSNGRDIATTTLQLTRDNRAAVAFGIYRSFNGDAPSRFQVSPAGSGPDATVEVRTGRVDGPFCLRASVIDIAEHESRLSNEVCFDDATFFGCAQTSPSLSLLSLMLLVMLRLGVFIGKQRHV